MRARLALLTAAICLWAIAVYAQPSDAQIIMDLTKPGLIKLTAP